MKNIIGLILFLCILPSLYVKAQWLRTYYRFDEFTSSSYQITSLKQDNSENIWVARFGAGVVKITPKGDTILYCHGDGLAEDYVECIETDKNGVLWFATTDGLSKYENNIWYNYLEVTDSSYLFFTDIKKDSKENLYFIGGTHYYGSNVNTLQIYKYNGIELKRIDNNLLNDLNWTWFKAADCYYENEIYLNFEGSICKIKNNKIEEIEALKGLDAERIKFDLDGILWAGVGNKVYKIQNDVIIDTIQFSDEYEQSVDIYFDKDNIPYINLTKQSSNWAYNHNKTMFLKNNEWKSGPNEPASFLKSIEQLKDGSFIHSNGDNRLNKFNSDYDSLINSVELRMEKLKSENILHIDIDNLGNKYLVNSHTRECDFSVFDENISKSYDVSGAYPSYIKYDSKGNVWGVYQGAEIFSLQYKNSKCTFNRDTAGCNESFSPYSPLIEDKESNFWIGGNYKIYKYNRKKWDSFKPTSDTSLDISSSCVDVFNNKWFVSNWGYLLKYNNKTWEKIELPNKFTNPTSLGFRNFMIDSDSKGRIWVCKDNYPLIGVFDGISWIYYDSTNGLKCNYISNLIIEKDKNWVWALDADRTSRFDGVKWDYPLKKYSSIKSRIFYCIKRDIDDTYWIGTHSGLIHWKEDKSLLTANNTNIENLNNNQLNGIVIYPNPVQNKINFFSERKLQKVLLFNILGEEVMEVSFTNNQDYDINIETLPRQATYIYKIQDEFDNYYTGKIYKD